MSQSQPDDNRVEGPVLHEGRPAFLFLPDYPTSGGYPFLHLEHDGQRYSLVGRGLFCPTNPSPTEIKALYDHWARQYNSQHPWLINLGVDIADVVHCFCKGDVQILDLGCGTGNTTLGLLMGLVGKGVLLDGVTVVDHSEAMIGEAKKALADYPVSYVVESVTTYEPSHSFDIILISLALDHFPFSDLERLFGDLRGHLAEGGVIAAVLTPARHSYLNVKEFLIGWTRGQGRVEQRSYTSPEGSQFTLEIIYAVKRWLTHERCGSPD